MGQDLSRRSVLRGAAGVGSAAAAAATLAACGGGSSPAGTTGGTPTATGTGAGAGSATGTSVPKADVPVGGGKVVGAAVVTQPAAGTYKAFSSVCTHQGCSVRTVSDNQINCPCHNSSFDANTGAVLRGPAAAPLAAKTVTESGSNLLVS